MEMQGKITLPDYPVKSKSIAVAANLSLASLQLQLRRIRCLFAAYSLLIRYVFAAYSQVNQQGADAFSRLARSRTE